MLPVLGVVLQIVFGLWWWFISCVSSDGERDVQIAGKMLFLGVSVLLGEVSIWIRLNKEHHAHWCSGHHPLRTWTGQKGRGRTDLLSAWSGHPVHLPLDMDTRGSGAFGLGLGPTVLLPLVLKPLSCQLSVSRAHKPHRLAGTWSGACQALELWENKLLPSPSGLRSGEFEARISQEQKIWGSGKEPCQFHLKQVSSICHFFTIHPCLGFRRRRCVVMYDFNFCDNEKEQSLMADAVGLRKMSEMLG